LQREEEERFQKAENERLAILQAEKDARKALK